MSEKKTERVKVKATVMWAFTNTINEMSGKYSIDLTNLSEAAVDAIEEVLNITPRTRADKPEKGFFITCTSQRPIKVLDKDGTVLPTDVKIGNGSKVTAIITYYDWEFRGKKSRSPSLAKLVVDELVEYVDDGSDDDEGEAL